MGSIVVDGSDYIRRTANLPTLRSGTMAGWVNLDSVTYTGQYHICGWRDNAAGHVCMFFNNNDLGIGNSSWQHYGMSANPTGRQGTWLYVAITASTTDLKGYWWYDDNGTLTLGGSAVPGGGWGADGSPASITVGCRSNYYDQQVPGKYAYWKVWDRELTQSDIEAEAYSPTYVDATNANTGFADDGTDIGPNSRDWTLSGTSTDSDTPPVEASVQAITRYDSFAEFVADGTIDMDDDVIKVRLVTGYTPSAAHDEIADVPSAMTGTTDVTLTYTGTTRWAQTAGVAKFDADDATFSFTSTGTPSHAIIFDDTSTGDKLIAYVTLGSTEITSGNALKLVWDADGIFTLD